ncbi:MAG: tRNA pseudouridine(55) synthase TruB [Bacteroidales bacterium]|nr:tRNA pseudouridine(55) synthase TruB [Bacteroidales bacterium]
MAPLVARPGMVLSRNIDDYPEGIVIPVDKPYRWTSADVIRKVKWMAIKHFGKKNLKVGHAGTLDPLATGVLLVCIGKATKLADEYQAHPKEYVAGVSFGATTASYDLEKEIDATFPLDGVSEEALRAVLAKFVGEQEQVAPLFSAKSVDGKRVYEIARALYKAGKPVDSDILKANRITVYGLELLSFDESLPRRAKGSPESHKGSSSLHCPPERPAQSPNNRINVASTEGHTLLKAEIRVECSKGTYIRALARDLGEALGSGAFLHSLRRTKTGPFRVEEALGLEEVTALL